MGRYEPRFHSGDLIAYRDGDMLLLGLAVEEITRTVEASAGWKRPETAGVNVRPIGEPLKPEPVFVDAGNVEQIYRVAV